jgi:hypothetical protein
MFAGRSAADWQNTFSTMMPPQALLAGSYTGNYIKGVQRKNPAHAGYGLDGAVTCPFTFTLLGPNLGAAYFRFQVCMFEYFRFRHAFAYFNFEVFTCHKHEEWHAHCTKSWQTNKHAVTNLSLFTVRPVSQRMLTRFSATLTLFLLKTSICFSKPFYTLKNVIAIVSLSFSCI